MKTTLAEARRDKSAADETAKTLQADAAARIGAAADRLELLNTQFGKGASGDAANRR